MGKFIKIIISIGMLFTVTVASAHTVSIGYENAGPGSVNFWYGSYHSPDENPAYATEGSFSLVGINSTTYGPINTPFTIHVPVKPAGLLDGITNFYASNEGSLTPVCTLGGSVCNVQRWQGVTFNGLSPGDYQFTYIPIANPTATWAPWNSGILTSTITLAGDIVGTEATGIPEPGILALMAAGLLGIGAVNRRRKY